MDKKFTLWLTGFPGTRKTTITKLLEKHLQERGFEVELFDEDMIHTTLTCPSLLGQKYRNAYTAGGGQDPTFGIGEDIANIVDLPSPRLEPKQKADRQFGDFIKVFVTGLSENTVGGMAGFAGIAGLSEAPDNADLVIDADQASSEETARKILRSLEERGYLPRLPVSGANYSEEEEAVVRKRLEDLGYL